MTIATRQQGVMIFGSRHDRLGGEIRINRADRGDARVVFSVYDSTTRTFYPGQVGLSPKEARSFGLAVISAADIIEGKPTDSENVELARARDRHERHVDLKAGCPLCELEAGHQRDRLSCETCGELLRPDEPFDGHPECREQE